MELVYSTLILPDTITCFHPDDMQTTPEHAKELAHECEVQQPWCGAGLRAGEVINA